jgi:hypothetical protein
MNETRSEGCNLHSSLRRDCEDEPNGEEHTPFCFEAHWLALGLQCASCVCQPFGALQKLEYQGTPLAVWKRGPSVLFLGGTIVRVIRQCFVITRSSVINLTNHVPLRNHLK